MNATAGTPEVTTAANDWVFTYTRPSSITDITYTVEVSIDLVTWITNGLSFDPVSTSGGIDTLTARYPRTTAPKIFFRLNVTR